MGFDGGETKIRVDLYLFPKLFNYSKHFVVYRIVQCTLYSVHSIGTTDTFTIILLFYHGITVTQKHTLVSIGKFSFSEEIEGGLDSNVIYKDRHPCS